MLAGVGCSAGWGVLVSAGCGVLLAGVYWLVLAGVACLFEELSIEAINFRERNLTVFLTLQCL